MGKVKASLLSREQIIELLRKHLPEWRSKYGLQRIALFGSFARGTATQGSDVDLLVEFCKPVGLEFIDVLNEVERLLGRKVDLITVETLRRGRENPRKRHIAESIERDMIYVE